MNDPRTIDCEEALRRLFDFLDGALEEGPHREVADHLERCRSCFSRAEFERRLKAHLAELGEEPVPPVFEQRIRALIGQLFCP